MSVHLIARILDADIPSQTTKLVLLKLARHASHNGRRIFPSVRAIAQAAQCSTRQAQRVLGALRDLGILACLKEGGHGPRDTSQYAFALPALEVLIDCGWDEFAARSACGAGQPASEGLLVSADKGDAMMSPLAELRVTLGGAKGDIWCRPNSQEEGSNSEKERAQAESSIPEANSHSGCHARHACDQQFETFLAAWPDRGASNRSRSLSAWRALSPEEQQAAFDGIELFQAAWKAAGRTYAVSAQSYLVERRWELTAPTQTGTEAAHIVAPWSQPWWQVVLHRLLSGTKATFVFAEARAGRGLTVRGDELAAAAAALPGLFAVGLDSAEAEAWRAWLVSRGIRLPDPGEPFDLFVPSHTPSGSGARR